jgi:Zn-dependent metalloprotease
MRWRPFFFTSLLLVPTVAQPAFAGPANLAGSTPGGFLALSGAEARAYVVPPDMRLDKTAPLANQNLTQERYQQYLGNAKVLGGQITVYRDGSGAIILLVGSHYPAIAPANRLLLSLADARRTVEKEIGPDGTWNVDLLINPRTGRYFYRVESRRFDSRWFYWIDAENGGVLNKYEGLTTDHGVGVKGDTKSMAGLTTLSGSSYQLVSSNGRQQTYDAQNRPLFPLLGSLFPGLFLPGTLATDSDNHWTESGNTSPGQPALVDAHYYAAVTDAYYASTHGRDSLDDAGMTMVSTAHFSRRYNNAFWNGEQMVYGDGDGVSFREFSGALDVVAHELTHGVTEFTSNLIYQNESGALNESFSDIMAASAEFFADANGLDPSVAPDWLVGEDIVLYPDEEPGIRNMADPAEDDDPDYYTERYTGTSDNGGVHTNSGIPNHAYYLLVNGGSNAGEARGHSHTGPVVTGVGLATAEQILYLAFTGLPEDATMCRARLATQAVAAAMFPSALASVSDAWEAVGVPDTC